MVNIFNKNGLNSNIIRIFFFKGVVGIIWFGFWWLLSYERPATCNSISEEERVFIEESIGETSSLATKVI